MQTSYFSRYKGENAVSIALKSPRGFQGRRYGILAPPPWLLKQSKHGLPHEEYTKHYYREVLQKLDAREVYEDLGEDAVLLCWERPEKFCHRHLVSRWLELSLGIGVGEYEIPNPS